MLLTILCIFLTVLSFGLLIWAQIKNLNFPLRSLSALAAGLLVGLLIKYIDLPIKETFFNPLFDFIGNTYIALLKMLVIPLVFSAIIYSITELRHHQGTYIIKLTLQIIILLLFLTAMSAVLGAGLAWLIPIHLPVSFEHFIQPQLLHDTHLSTVVLAMLPANPVEAMVKNNISALVIFSALLGFSALKLYQQHKKQAQAFIDFIHSTFLVARQLAVVIITLTPYGVFSLMAALALKQGLSSFNLIFSFIAIMYLAMFMVLIMHTVLVFLAGFNPIDYYKKVGSALIVAFSTRSSLGTLPITIEVLSNRLKLQKSIAHFTPSLGSMIGLNACAGTYPSVLAVITLMLLGQAITWKMIGLLALISMMASFAIAGFPGSAFFAASITFSTLGLPFNLVALLQAVEPIIDMGRTAINVNGAMTAAAVVNRLNKEPTDFMRPQDEPDPSTSPNSCSL